MTPNEGILMWAIKILMGVLMTIGAFVFNSEKKAREKSEKEMKDEIKDLKEKQITDKEEAEEKRQKDLEKIRQESKTDRKEIYDRLDGNKTEILAAIEKGRQEANDFHLDIAKNYQTKSDCQTAHSHLNSGA